jgi:hypothetical protein
MAKTQTNFRKVPNRILAKVRSMKKDNLQVGCVRKLTRDHLTSGDFAHLGLKWETDSPVVPRPSMPPASSGRYSGFNQNGREIVRRDLPMVTKTITIETPNWGDWSYGSHPVDLDRDVYQREFQPPKEIELEIKLVSEPVVGEYVFAFTLSEVLNRKARGFESDLLINVNLLQENVGAVDVLPTDADRETYLRSIHVNWELLPPGPAR